MVGLCTYSRAEWLAYGVLSVQPRTGQVREAARRSSTHDLRCFAIAY